MRCIYLEFTSAGWRILRSVWSCLPGTYATDGIGVPQTVTSSPEYAGTCMGSTFTRVAVPYRYDKYIRIALWCLDAPQTHLLRAPFSCIQGFAYYFPRCNIRGTTATWIHACCLEDVSLHASQKSPHKTSIKGAIGSI